MEYLTLSKNLSRRVFVKGLGFVSIGLPLLFLERRNRMLLVEAKANTNTSPAS